MVNSLYIFNSDTLRRKAATRNKVCGFPDLQQRYLQNLGGAYKGVHKYFNGSFIQKVKKSNSEKSLG